jgi:hypothetical protein
MATAPPWLVNAVARPRGRCYHSPRAKVGLLYGGQEHHGRTSQYLRPQVGRLTFHAVILPRPHTLSTAFHPSGTRTFPAGSRGHCLSRGSRCRFLCNSAPRAPHGRRPREPRQAAPMRCRRWPGRRLVGFRVPRRPLALCGRCAASRGLLAAACLTALILSRRLALMAPQASRTIRGWTKQGQVLPHAGHRGGRHNSTRGRNGDRLRCA